MSVFDNASEMFVTKRNGNKEIISFDKILQRIKKIGKEQGIQINYTSLVMKIIDQLYDGIPTDKIDEISAEQCATMSSIHYDYGTLASSLIVSNHHRNTVASFSKTMKKLHSEQLLSDEFIGHVNTHAKQLDAMCDYTRDYLIDYFGFKTLERSYLMTIKRKVYERPQMMFMRLAVALHGSDLERIAETYRAFSLKQMIHGTPSLFNAGMKRQQMSSCFARDTPIHTVAGPVAIQSVKPGDKVVTHTGEVREVTQLHVNRLGDHRMLMSLQCHGLRPLVVTNDHRVRTYHGPTGDIAWTPVGELTTDDFVQIPRNKGIRFVPENGDTAKLLIDTKINKFFGIWLRYGDFLYYNDASMNGPQGDEPVGIQIILPTDKEDAMLFCKEMTAMFGDVRVEYSTYDNGMSIMRFVFKKMGDDFLQWFTKERRVPPTFYQFPTHWVRSFLSGWNVTEDELTDSQVPDEIYALCRMHHLDHLTFLPLDYTESEDVVQHDDHVFVRFESADAEEAYPDPDTEVYTLGVEEDHSYSVGGIVAENCYLLSMESDSIEGIYNTLKDCAVISKYAGGIGLHIHNIRATKSHIAGTNGTSNGIVPMLRVFNHTAKYVDQCVHPNTIIYTTQGPLAIRDVVQMETSIFGMHGDPEIVGNVLEHSYTGPMLSFTTEHSSVPLQITPEHPIFAVAADHITGMGTRTLQHQLNQKKVVPDWIEAKDVALGDLFAVPIPLFDKDVDTIRSDDCYMYGLLLANGSFLDIDSCDPTSCRLVTYTPHVYEWVVNYLESWCVKYDAQIVDVERFSYEFKWNRPAHLPFRWHDFYDAGRQQRIAPRWLNLPTAKSRLILKGVVDAVGFIEEEIVLRDLSKSWVESLRYLCLKMGVLTRTTTARMTLRDDSAVYSLRIPATVDTCMLFGLEYDGREAPFVRSENWLFSPVTAMGSVDYSGVVYDLQMSVQHDYLLGNALVHNGGGKRNGSIAIYLEPWHADIEVFLQMRKNHGEEELKARDLFYALWIPDLFMQRVKDAGKWTLFCPNECPGLADVHSEAFETLYTQYEASGKGRVTMNARDLWFKILDAQMETGTPYLLYKDAANRKSNQQNLGTIKSSNLCTEIIEYSDADSTAVCNLGSIALPAFVVVDPSGIVPPTYDFDRLHQVTRMMTYNLNRVIDINYYPTPKTSNSNLRHRPIGMGVQGLADTFMMMGYAFGSPESMRLNQEIFETMYHAGLTESCEMAKRDGHYESFPGSPASEGKLQFDLWSREDAQLTTDPSDPHSPFRYDWTALKKDICKYGLRNSLLMAPMPTASTSQILGYNECIEPITSNIYSRRTLAGEFIVTNKFLVKDLVGLGMWNEKVKNHIIANNGSIQQLEEVPAAIREKYRTVWEIPMRTVIDMAADRGVYIDQSQSMNLWMEDPTYGSLTSMHFYSWSKGLKTGIYYLRRRAKHQAQQFTIEPEKATHDIPEEDEICEMCSS